MGRNNVPKLGRYEDGVRYEIESRDRNGTVQQITTDSGDFVVFERTTQRGLRTTREVLAACYADGLTEMLMSFWFAGHQNGIKKGEDNIRERLAQLLPPNDSAKALAVGKDGDNAVSQSNWAKPAKILVDDNPDNVLRSKGGRGSNVDGPVFVPRAVGGSGKVILSDTYLEEAAAEERRMLDRYRAGRETGITVGFLWGMVVGVILLCVAVSFVLYMAELRIDFLPV